MYQVCEILNSSDVSGTEIGTNNLIIVIVKQCSIEIFNVEHQMIMV